MFRPWVAGFWRQPGFVGVLVSCSGHGWPVFGSNPACGGEADHALGEPGCGGTARGYDVVLGGTTVTGTGL